MKFVIKKFEKEKISELTFDKLTYKNNTFNFILSLIKEMDFLTYLNLSGFVFENENVIYNILNEVDKRVFPFTLEIKDIYLSKKMIKIIKDIERNDLSKLFIIDKKYNGIINQVDKEKIRKKKKKEKKFFYCKNNENED
jgi:hypothetical protein